MSDPPDGPPLDEAVVQAVRSRIIEQLINSIGRDEVLRSRASHYTKSDSGLYGKYQKYEDVGNQVVELVKQQLTTILEEFASADAPIDQPGS